MTAIATDRGFENYVRTTYPVVKEGEGVIVVYDAQTSPVAPVRGRYDHLGAPASILLQSVFAKK
jgi:hypothetical protein